MSAETIKQILDKRPLIISGPCSAETREQVLATAEALKQTGRVDILRAGIWKPRTRPGSFEGVGSVGLSWLQEAKDQTGLPLAVEVANARQTEEALKAGIDVLWIGARTTVNPFSVQEVADVLYGVDVPVYIKNPVNADVELWLGAYERMQKTGDKAIGLIHRGFSHYGNTVYRNAPMWHLALEMKRRCSDVPFIIDPSHICGNRHLLQETIQKAMDLRYDGVMIESHINPDAAWSDARQQVTPNNLVHILDQIIWRQEEMPTEELHTLMQKYRTQINQLDNEIIELLASRMQLVQEIGKYKKENDVTILQVSRWKEILDRLCAKGAALGLSEEFIIQYFDAIHLESIKQQDMVMNQKKD
ncbi:chorismate mutase [Edaphocola flava]|uniref:chorismate mutase n=1 Tax=Edaphocola flava TaxID=2499629 RepID=UPI00100BABF5|nr:chorismate mutase [Edaphocola flava]